MNSLLKNLSNSFMSRKEVINKFQFRNSLGINSLFTVVIQQILGAQTLITLSYCCHDTNCVIGENNGTERI